jgi:hypothetical protein
MKVFSFLPQRTLPGRIETALSSAQFLVGTVVSAKECLFAQYEAVLVDSDSYLCRCLGTGKAAAPGELRCIALCFCPLP